MLTFPFMSCNVLSLPVLPINLTCPGLSLCCSHSRTFSCPAPRSKPFLVYSHPLHLPPQILRRGAPLSGWTLLLLRACTMVRVIGMRAIGMVQGALQGRQVRHPSGRFGAAPEGKLGVRLTAILAASSMPRSIAACLHARILMSDHDSVLSRSFQNASHPSGSLVRWVPSTPEWASYGHECTMYQGLLVVLGICPGVLRSLLRSRG